MRRPGIHAHAARSASALLIIVPNLPSLSPAKTYELPCCPLSPLLSFQSGSRPSVASSSSSSSFLPRYTLPTVLSPRYGLWSLSGNCSCADSLFSLTVPAWMTLPPFAKSVAVVGSNSSSSNRDSGHLPCPPPPSSSFLQMRKKHLRLGCLLGYIAPRLEKVQEGGGSVYVGRVCVCVGREK